MVQFNECSYDPSAFRSDMVTSGVGNRFDQPMPSQFFRMRLVLELRFFASCILGKMVSAISLLRKPLTRYLPSLTASIMHTTSGAHTLNPEMCLPLTFFPEQTFPISSYMDLTGTMSVMASISLRLQVFETSA